VKTTRHSHELAYRRSNVSRANGAHAMLGQGSRQSARLAADPVRDGRVRNWSAAEPVRIEFDLDLFEADGQGRVAVAAAGAVKNGRRTIDDPLSDIRLVQVAPEDENRQHRPIMRVFRYPSATEIHHSADDHAAGIMQDVHP